MVNTYSIRFHFIAAIAVITLMCSCDDFLSSVKNENTQQIETLLYNLDDLDVCMNGAYGAFSSPYYYGSVVLAECLGSDCAAPTKNPSIQPDFTIVNNNNYFFSYQCSTEDFQAGVYLSWGSFVTNNSNVVIHSILDHLPQLVTKNDTLNANRLLGEGYLMRAAVEFYNNFFVGRQYHHTTRDSLSTLYRRNPILDIHDVSEPRKTVAQVYQFLEEDLKMAIQLLPSTYDNTIHPTAYQLRCKKDVAIALLAKVYFQQNNFDSALVYSNLLLGNTMGQSAKFPLATSYSYKRIFQTIEKTNYQPNIGEEMIMALDGSNAFQATNPSKWTAFQWTAFKNLNYNDISSANFRIVIGDSLRQCWVRADISKDIRFQQMVYITQDNVKESPAGQWTTLKAAYPFANTPWMRASEFHLMRAEIYLHKGNIPSALLELNLIRNRAGLVSVPNTVSQSELYKLIVDERSLEFCFENIRRWDNLRLASLSGSIYGSYLPEPFVRGKIPLGNRKDIISETELDWNADRLYCLIPMNEYLFNPGLK